MATRNASEQDLVRYFRVSASGSKPEHLILYVSMVFYAEFYQIFVGGGVGDVVFFLLCCQYSLPE